MDFFRKLIFTMKMFFISAGAVFVALGIKVSVPAVRSVVLAWMKPPYLYILINVIIIMIVVSSRLQQIRDVDPPARLDRSLSSVKTPPPAWFAPPEIKTIVEERNPAVVVQERDDRIVDLKPVVMNGSIVDADDTEDDAYAEDPFEESVISVPEEKIPLELKLDWPRPMEENPSVPPTVDRRKTVKTALEGTAAGNQAKHETLENVWKLIMEGRSRNESVNNNSDSPPVRSMTREESPLSRDELNRRVEEFIQKFNEDMGCSAKNRWINT